LAYTSDESGRREVYVRALSGPHRRIVASSGGGSQPVWRRDGRELLHVDRDGRLQARAVRRQPSGDLALGAAAPLAELSIGSGHWGTQYDVSADGQRIYFIDHTPLPKPSTVNLLLSWQTLVTPR
jgi:hypothetical protein